MSVRHPFAISHTHTDEKRRNVGRRSAKRKGVNRKMMTFSFNLSQFDCHSFNKEFRRIFNHTLCRSRLKFVFEQQFRFLSNDS
ncbi:hypothetical protein ANTQUA_LOCUS1458 [Anthophora quadrimaculata]